MQSSGLPIALIAAHLLCVCVTLHWILVPTFPNDLVDKENPDICVTSPMSCYLY